MLDRTALAASTLAEADAPAEDAVAVERKSLARRAWQFFVTQSFSSLTRRILFLNVAGLLALVVGILYLSQFRAGLIDARVQSLLVQGEIIAGAIAASATVETNAITIDPDRLLELHTGESYGPADEALSALEFPISALAPRNRPRKVWLSIFRNTLNPGASPFSSMARITSP